MRDCIKCSWQINQNKKNCSTPIKLLTNRRINMLKRCVQDGRLIDAVPKIEKRASPPFLIQVLLQSRPIANHTNMESPQSRLLLQAWVSFIQICPLTISHSSIYHNTDSGSPHSHLARLRVGPDKDWDLEWSRTNSNESQTHFLLFPLAQLRVTQGNEIPPPILLLRPRAVEQFALFLLSHSWQICRCFTPTKKFSVQLI